MKITRTLPWSLTGKINIDDDPLHGSFILCERSIEKLYRGGAIGKYTPTGKMGSINGLRL